MADARAWGIKAHKRRAVSNLIVSVSRVVSDIRKYSYEKDKKKGSQSCTKVLFEERVAVSSFRGMKLGRPGR